MQATTNPTPLKEELKDLTTKQLAAKLGVTDRMINYYRATAEVSQKRRLGYRKGRVIYFSPEDQELIRAAKNSELKPSEFAQSASPVEKTTKETGGQRQQAEYFGGVNEAAQTAKDAGLAAGQMLAKEFWAGVAEGFSGNLNEGLGKLQLAIENVEAVTELAISPNVYQLDSENWTETINVEPFWS